MTRESLKFSGTADLAAASPLATVASGYASVAAAIEAIGAANCVYESFEDGGGNGDGGYRRIALGMLINGVDGTGVQETLYLVVGSDLGGTQGVRLESVATLAWLSGGVASALPGADATHKEAKAVTVTSTGLLEARTGVGPVAIGRSPATVEIPDIAEAKGILRVMAVSASSPATAYRPTRMRWR